MATYPQDVEKAVEVKEKATEGLQPDTKSESVLFGTVETENDYVDAENKYSEADYKKLKRKIDRYVLPLMWLCYGVQQTDKTSLGTQAIFGIRQDTNLHGQQYSWLTTVFYLTYLFCEFPSNIVIQRFMMGRTLSLYMILWGVVVLCIGFANNFSQLMALRALQGALECCISPGFILIIGSWYTRREHPSRALVFQSANAGFGVIAQLVMYGLGVAGQKNAKAEPWRYISYFLGGLTILTGLTCFVLLGTPSEVRWLNPREKEMANARIMANNTGHDVTAKKSWKWRQARECLVDVSFWFTGINAFLCSVPNGGLTAFGSIMINSFGFSVLDTILLDIPRDVVSVLYFVVIGLVTTKWANLRLYWMIFSTIPPLIGFLGMSLLPDENSSRWNKYGLYIMTVTFVVSLFLAWTLIPSNVAGRTKRTLTSSFTFVGYCVGNMVGSQIFRSKDAPRYISGTIGCAVCFGLEFLLLVSWRLLLVHRNKRKAAAVQNDGLSEEERIRRGKALGEQDYTDFENPYFRYTL